MLLSLQYDKRIIAYTSVAHMNLVFLGIFSFNSIGLAGSIIQSLSHGFVASALFLLIGVVYDRHGSRMVKYYGDFLIGVQESRKTCELILREIKSFLEMFDVIP